MKILIVDNDHRNQQSLGCALDKHTIIPASTIKNAISHLNYYSEIDLIISEIDLPDSDGFHFLKFLKNKNKFRNIPVMICSSLNNYWTLMKCINLGAIDYLIKPVDKVKLIEKIDTLINKKTSKVLIIDDEQVILNVLSKILECLNYEVLCAHSAEEALELINSVDLDFVISDIDLPGINGLELLKIIKNKVEQLPVLMITGNSIEFPEENAIAAGADGYIEKPFKSTNIIRAINSLNLKPRMCKAQ